ncbi:hypothetical protein niasHT_005207 [Heterodera trifolii]|uniref:Paired domain-containing protein n=1 Tax=Heterodera trifolii TaxID=157864 RepID=A0ABD2LS52_9BILA
MLSPLASSSSARPSYSRHHKQSTHFPRPTLIKSEPEELCSSVTPISSLSSSSSPFSSSSSSSSSSPSSSSSKSHVPKQLRPPPLIDTSTPESLERDFHAWLKGELSRSERPFCARPSHCFSAQFSPPSAMFLTPLGNVKNELPTDFGGDFVFGMEYEPSNNDFCTSTAAFAPSISMNGPFPQMPTQMIRMPMPSFSASITEDQQMAYLLSSAGQSPSGSSQHSSLEGSPLQPNCHQTTLSLPAEVKGIGKYEFNDRKMLTELSGEIKTDGSKKMDATDAAMTAPNSPGGRSSGTNQLGRTYSPGLPLSMVERQKIVQLFHEGWKICDISKYLCVTHSCVSKILQRFRATGSVRPKDAKEGRQESPLVAAIRDYRQRLGIMRQSEIREQLIRDGLCRRENAPSRSSINHILRTKLSGLESPTIGTRSSNQTTENVKGKGQTDGRGENGGTAANAATARVYYDE